MFNFEDHHIRRSGIENLLDSTVVEHLCGGSKFRMSGRPLLLETSTKVLTHLNEPVTLEVEAQRLFVRPSLGEGHNHLGPEFTQALPVVAARTFDGLDVYFGMTKALGFHIEPLG